MSDLITLPHADPDPARLGPHLIAAWRRVRLARLCLRRARSRRLALSDALHVSVSMLADLDQQRDQLRGQNQALRDELRRYTARQMPEAA